MNIRELKMMVEKAIRENGSNVEVSLENDGLIIESDDGLLTITKRDNIDKMAHVLDAFVA